MGKFMLYRICVSDLTQKYVRLFLNFRRGGLYCSVSQCVAVYYSVLQCVAVVTSSPFCIYRVETTYMITYSRRTRSANVLQCVAVYYSVLQRVAEWCSVLQVSSCKWALWPMADLQKEMCTIRRRMCCCSVLQGSAVYCSVLQRVAECRSALSPPCKKARLV